MPTPLLHAACLLASLFTSRQPQPPEPASQPIAGAPKVRTPDVLWSFPIGSHSFGGASVADVDGDGQLDIAFATYFGDSKVRVVRGATGQELWSYDAGEGKGSACLDASQRFADLDGDGALDLVVPVSNTSQVLAFDARTGVRKWTYEAGQGACIDTPPWIGDLDNDGKPDVVVGTFKGQFHVIRGTDGALIKTVDIAPRGAVQTCPTVTDLDGDGVPDFIGATFNGDNKVNAVNGKSGQAMWSVPTGGSIYHGPSTGDLNGDGRADFVIGSYDGAVYAFTGEGERLWTVRPGDRYFMSPTVIADVLGLGAPQVIIACTQVTVIKADGAIAYSVPVAGGRPLSQVTRGVSVADLDGDGRLDLAYLTTDGLFRVVRGDDGTLLYEFDCARVADFSLNQGSQGPVIADLDGNGRLDVFIVAGGGDLPKHPRGVALCLTGFDGTGPGWLMLRHDPHNTGNVTTAINEP